MVAKREAEIAAGKNRDEQKAILDEASKQKREADLLATY